MGTLTDAQIMELTTTVRFDRNVYTNLQDTAAQLERALVETIQDEGIAALTEYFVQARENVVQVGLRFEGMEPIYVRETADDVLASALNRIRPTDGATKRTSTTLVGA